MRRELLLAAVMLAIAGSAVVSRYVPETPVAEPIYCDDGRTYTVSPPLACPEGPLPPRKKRA